MTEKSDLHKYYFLLAI